MTNCNTAGVVIIMLHVLQHCSTTNVTTMEMSEDTSTSESITLSTSDPTTMPNNSTSFVSEYSDGYVQNGNPQVTTSGVSIATIIVSVERSEQVANASPTTQHPNVGEISTNPALSMKDDETNSERNNSTSTEQPSTPYHIQSDDAQVSDKFVSSSKMNMTDSREEMDVSDVDTDGRSVIAEKETSMAYETETQSSATDEGNPENEVVTSLPDDLTRAGMKIGEADVLDDDADYFENLSETSSTMKNDYDVEKNGTYVVAGMYLDNTTNLSINDMKESETPLIADDIVERNEQDTSKPILSEDAMAKLPAGDISMQPNETTPSANTSSESGSPDIDNITNTPTVYASSFNETDEKRKASESDAEPLQDLNMPSIDSSNNTFGNENNPYVQQQTNSNGTEVPTDNHNVSNRTSENDSAPQNSESSGGFQEVHLLADDISLDNPEGESINEYDTGENQASDKKPSEETIDEGNSNSTTSLSDSSGSVEECDAPSCENSNNQTTLNNIPNVSETTESLPQYTPNDQENMSNLQNTGNDSRPVNVGSSMDEPIPLSIPGTEPQLSEVGEDKPLPSSETQPLQMSTQQDNYSTQSSQGDMTHLKEFTVNGQIVNKTYIVPMGDVLKIVINQAVTSVSTAPQMPQEDKPTEDNEDDDELGEPVQQDPPNESVEVLADDITFVEVDEETAPQMPQEDTPTEDNEDDDQLGEPVQQDPPNESVEVLADDITFVEVDEETEQGSLPVEENSKDSYITTTTFKPYFISESREPTPPSAKCPFSAKTPDTKTAKDEQQRTVEHRPEGQIVEDPYYYEVDPFCLTRHHVLIPAVPVILPQWCFVPDTPDFMCPRYDLGFHIAFAHETQRDMYYRCVYGQAILLKCPNLHYWDDERKICMLTTDFNHYQRQRYHPSQNLYDQATHHHCQHCRRNFLLPQELDPTAQCSDRILLACNTDGTLSVYECPGFYYYDRQIQLRWYADLERCDYPADGDGPWR